jgi:hypothetical protein
MLVTRNREATEQICGCKIDALRVALGPGVQAIETETVQKRLGLDALCSDLYDRDQPVRDSSMFARQIGTTILLIVVLAAAMASLGSHIVTFYLMGYYVLAWLLGPILTGLAIAAGYVLFERVLAAHQSLQTIAFAAIARLAVWGLVQWAETRAIITTHACLGLTDSPPTSYVDGAAQPQEEQPPTKSDENEVQKKMTQAWIWFLLSADLLLGIGLAYYEKKRTDPDFVAWRKAKELTEDINQLRHARECLLAIVETAKRDCMAGILRALHTPKKKHSPYFRALPLILCMLCSHQVLHAQEIERQEGILIDVSGSIGSGGANSELFREYLQAVKQHLASEAPSSRIVVCVISTDSFGSTRELLKGWTPEAHGVFTDELMRARRQLVASFEAKSSSLTPISSGTDIFGALWRMKAILESETKDDGHVTREIWIWSDMMNETPEFDMLALLATGPDKMLEQARANGLLVPLKGYKIHVLGASTRGLSPQGWNTTKAFWIGYFPEAGAELSEYSAESSSK